MADVKISALPASTTPLTGSEVLPLVQGGVTKKVAVTNLTGTTVSNAGEVGVGGDTAGVVAGVAVTSKFCVKQDGTNPVAGFVKAENTTAGSGSGTFACRSRGTLAAPTIVQNGDSLWNMYIAGNDGVDLALAAQIDVQVDGTPGSNDMPGRIVFSTTPDGSQTPTEVARMSSSQVFSTVNDAVISTVKIGRGAGSVGSNIAIGFATLQANTTGSNNTVIGVNALRTNNTGLNNTATGNSALYNNTSGNNNTATGFNALVSNNTGANNAAFGLNTSFSNTSGTQNTATGNNALYSNTTGGNNIASGFNALANSTTGSNNTAIGYRAGSGVAGVNANTTGSNNTYIGNETVGSAVNNTNENVFGNLAVGLGSNTTVIGNSSTTLTKAFGVIVGTNYTVATLPSASTSGVGARAFVTDALTPTFGATVVTGGAVAVPVYSDGTNWKVG